MKVRSDADLEQLRKEGLSSLYPQRAKITVGMATCGRSAGAGEVFACFREEISKRGLDVSLSATGCLGFCQQEPIVTVHLPGIPRHIYSRVDRELALGILDGITTGNLPERGLFARVCEDRLLLTGERIRLAEQPEGEGVGLEHIPFFARQVKVATRNCGYIDPGSIAEYTARGGYLALRKALSMKPEEVIEEISRSGLRGRGGGGFPTGRKWLLTRQAPGEEKYVICNADEGDPGAYMDRSILEGDPHAVLEGMIIGGYAIGAKKGIVYVRSEYPLAVAAIQEAIRQAEEYGFLGDDIFGSGFSFRITVVKGQGAFVCGEETALIAA
ncbi:MAG: NADH-quinone oxidoreductase subunit F, partial [Thermacetogeniaceae bacterium]